MDWVGWVEVAALALTGWAVWLSLPRPPSLEWERWFKVCLSVFEWTAVEEKLGQMASVGEVEDLWRKGIGQTVPFHPAGRLAENKLRAPADVELPVPALPGEMALLTELSAISEPAARWVRMFRDDPANVDALGDPRALGESYDPARFLGPDAGWEAVAIWSPAVMEALARRNRHVVWALVGAEDEGPWSEVAPNLRVRSVAGLADSPLETRLLAMMDDPADRFVVVVGDGAALAVAAALAASPALVDRVLAVVSPGHRLVTNDNQRQTLASLLDHRKIAPELQRIVPWFSIVAVDPDSPLAAPWADWRFPVKEAQAEERTTLTAVDLGPLPRALLPRGRVERALVLVVTAYVAG